MMASRCHPDAALQLAVQVLGGQGCERWGLGVQGLGFRVDSF